MIKTELFWPHMLSGVFSGFSSLSPFSRYCLMSLLSIPWYGGAPNEKSSQSRTPKDHWRKQKQKKDKERQRQRNKQNFSLKCVSAYHITFLSENVLCHCFKAHPFHWQFSSITSHGILVFIIQFSCQTKVCNFHHQIVIQPEDNQRVQNTLTKDFVVDQNGIILTTYMQFLAAKSLWTIFISVRYAIPFAVPSPNPSNRFVSIA